MTLVVGSLQLQPSYIPSRSVSKCHSYILCQNGCQKRSRNPKSRTSLSKLSFVPYSHFEKHSRSELKVDLPITHQRHQNHYLRNASRNASRNACVQANLAKSFQLLKPLSFSGSILGGCLHVTSSPLRGRRIDQIQRSLVVNQSGCDEKLGDNVKSHLEGDLEFCARRPVSPEDEIETVDESGYVIKVSKELMSVFEYVEKVKRARLRELSHTLRQVAYACLFLSCVKGIITPLIEVFKTHPPKWGKLIMILGAFDAFGITYLALKASQPLDRLSSLATECESERDMMGSIEKEEEHMLALAVELVRLFRRLRNLALCTAVTQFAHILHAMLKLKKTYPNLAIHIIKFVKSWLSTPWV